MNCILHAKHFRVLYFDHLAIFLHEVCLMLFLRVEFLKQFWDSVFATFLRFLLDSLLSQHLGPSLHFTFLLDSVDLHGVLNSVDSFTTFTYGH